MSEYNHTQSSAATVWTITHNLNSPEVVTDAIVQNGSFAKVIPVDVVLTSNNVLTITFSSAKAGSVRIIA